MKRVLKKFLRSTNFLRGIIILIGIAVIALSIALFPMIARLAEEAAIGIASEIAPRLAFLQYTFLIGLYAATIPFFFAMYQTLKILSYIDKNKAFSELSVRALKSIKYCGVAMSILFLLGGMPGVYFVAELDDAPGLVLIGLAIVFAPILIATLASVLQKLLQEAIGIKSENDLTI